ncbi:MAG TPA: PKD domain-containing protein [Bacteroidia bacterium]|jgi:PKD repeat protein
MKKIIFTVKLSILGIYAIAAGHTASISGFTNATCNGQCNGTAASAVSGGTGPFAFSWTSSSGYTSTAQNVVGLCAGTYTVTVTDMSDMSDATASVTILQPSSGPGAVVTVTNDYCGTSNGEISLSSFTGISPFTFSLNGGPWAATTNFTGLGAGTHTIVIKDANGCSSIYSPVITSGTPVSVTLPPSSTICAGSAVALTSSVSGGTPNYTYSWAPLTGMNSGNIANPVVSPLSTTTYSIVVTDQNGCAQTATVTVNVNPADDASFSYSSATYCQNATNPTPTITGLAGGTFSAGPGLAITSASGTINLAASTPGNYYVIYTTSGACPDSDTTSLMISAPPDAAFSYTYPAYCTGDNIAIVPALAAGASAGMFSSSPAGIIFVSNVTGEVDLAASASGVYTITNTLAATGGCATASAFTTLTIEDAGQVNFTMVPDSTNAYNFWCFNNSTGTAVSYLWDFGDGSSSTAASPTHTYPGNGIFNVCLIAATSSGCGDTLCRSINVSGTLNPCNALFNIGDNFSSPDPNTYTITDLSYGWPLSYLWDFGDTTTSTQQHPSHVYAGAGPYEICLTVDNGSGCVHTYCDSIFSVDSIGRAGTPISFTVVDGPSSPFSVGVPSHIINTGVSAYPNPFSEHVTFIVNSDNPGEIFNFELTDLLGKNVVQINGIGEKQFVVPRNGLGNGIYFYRIIGSGTTDVAGKIIVK